MKKIALSIALVAMMGVSFVSCNETAKEAPATEEGVEVIEEVTPVAEETITEEAPATEEGATEETATEEVVTEEAAN